MAFERQMGQRQSAEGRAGGLQNNGFTVLLHAEMGKDMLLLIHRSMPIPVDLLSFFACYCIQYI